MRKGFTLIELMIVIAIIAIIAAIAIPNLLESRVTANESAASASLKSGVFAAEVQFQGGGYLDRDQDNVGEYGTMRMLAGIEASSKTPGGVQATSLRLLTGPLANTGAWNIAGAAAATPGLGVANGFLFGSLVPSMTSTTEATTELYFDGLGGTTNVLVASIAASDGTANAGERGWAAACVPTEWGNAGRRVFAIGADGQVRSPANPAVLTGIFKGAAAPTNGERPRAGAVAFAIATLLNTEVATAAVTMGLTMFDSTNYSGLPVYAK